MAYSKTRLQRSKKEKYAGCMEAEQNSPRFTRKQNTFTESFCFFYGEDISSEQLHETIIEPRHEKTCFRPNPTQTGLYS